MDGSDKGSRDFLDTKSGFCDALDSLKLTKAITLKQFSKGGNFSRYCQQFIDYVNLTGLKNENLHILLLQNVDSITYSKLRAVDLTDVEKRDAEIFCRKYMDAMYGDELVMLKNELLACHQNEGEDVDTFVHRLREKATIAYTNQDVSDDNCLLALLNGVRSTDMKRKLNEADLENFSEAVKLAKRIERVERMAGSKNDPEFDADWTQDTVRAQQVSDTFNEKLDHGSGKSFKARRYLDFRVNNKHRSRGIQCWGCGLIGHKLNRCWWNSPKSSRDVLEYRHRNTIGGSRQHLNCKLAVDQVGKARRIKMLISMFWACSQVIE